MKYKSWEERIREDERKRILNEIKQRKQKILKKKRDFLRNLRYYIFQKMFALFVIFMPTLLIWLLKFNDITVLFFTIPVGVALFFTNDKVFLEDYYKED